MCTKKGFGDVNPPAGFRDRPQWGRGHRLQKPEAVVENYTKIAKTDTQ